MRRIGAFGVGLATLAFALSSGGCGGVKDASGMSSTVSRQFADRTQADVSGAGEETAAPTDPVIAQYQNLYWSDEFTGPAVDKSKWGYEKGKIRNNEPQYYTASDANAFVSGGCLILRALKEKKDGALYTSASINTRGRMAFQYGRVEMRCKLPVQQGAWPAFWMMGGEQGSWPACGETDIFEFTGKSHPNYIYSTLHWGKDSASHKSLQRITYCADPENWHVYGCVWNEKSIAFYMDGSVYATMDTQSSEMSPAFHQKNYLLVNLALGNGDAWVGAPDATTAFPSDYVVDYVRVYR